MTQHRPVNKSQVRRRHAAERAEAVRRSKASHLSRVGAAAVIGLAVTGTVQPAAQAVVVDDAITNVWVERDRVGYWDRIRVDMTWAVPNGSRGGDTFDLALPPELLVDPGLTLQLKDGASNEVVANAEVVDVAGVQTVRFTLTDYVRGRLNIRGNAYFDSAWQTEIVKPDSTVNFSFDTSTKRFPDTVVIDKLEAYKGPHKWHSWLANAPADKPDNHLHWGLVVGEITPDMVGKNITFVDEPGAGSQVDCTAITVTYLDYRPDGTTGWASSRPPAPGEMTCTPEKMSITVKVDDKVGQGLQIYGFSTVTDYTAESYPNHGEITVGDAATPTHVYDQTVVRSSGGGSGSGTVQTVSVGDLVWQDTDRDGVQDAGEPGIVGVALTITGPDGQPVLGTDGTPLRAVTGTDGSYSFTGLPALTSGQSYTVAVDSADPATQSALAGLIPTRTDGGDPATDSSTGTATSTAELTTDGASDTGLDFGFVVPAVRVGDLVWLDRDHNGVQDAGEPGIQGVVLTLTGPDGKPVTDVTDKPVAPATTGADGGYTFTGLPVLPAGQHYTVTVDRAASAAALAGLQPTTAGVGDAATDSSTGSATSGALTADGAADLTLDFGYYAPAVSVGDKVWEDLDADGVQDAGEPGIAGVELALTGPDGKPVTDINGKLVQPITTGTDGSYTFGNLPTLPAGQHYTVTVDGVPAGLRPTVTGAGTTATDSSTGSATSGELTTHGAADTSLDFGFVRPVSVGDRVWVDSNGDGVQGGAEPGLADVVLTLTGPDGKPVTDLDGNPVRPVTTGPDGSYLFTGLAPLPAGQHYTVTVDETASAGALDGYVPTRTGAGTPATDSSAGSAESGDVAASGASDRTLDFGFVKPVSVGDRVWVDRNGNGVQDSGEPGLADVVLTLTGPDGKPVTDVHGAPVTAATTDSAGAYLFGDLPVLAPGQVYTVTIDEAASADALDGYVPTRTGAGTPATDSATGSAVSGELVTSGAADRTLDFGFVVPVTVGDKVWVDTDQDGVQDPDEPGLAGVTLTITGPGGAPVTDVHGNPVAPVTTTSTGAYTFTGLPVLPAGQSYTVTVTDVPAGYVPTRTGAGTPQTDSSTGSAATGDLATSGASDSSLDFGFYQAVSVGDRVWVDSNGNGLQDGGEPGIADVVLTLTGPDGNPVTDVNGAPVGPQTTGADGGYLFSGLPVLPTGQHYTVTVDMAASADALDGYVPTRAGDGSSAADSSTGSATSGDVATSGATDRTLDFGFVKPVQVGDRVWKDLNGNGIQEEGEPGISGVVLTLTGPDGKPVTDVYGNPVPNEVTEPTNGWYVFENLPQLPAGQSYTVTVDEAASADALTGLVPTLPGAGSDPTLDSATGTADSTQNLSGSGASDLHLDFGYRPALVSAGDTVWLDEDRDGIQDAGEPGIAGVVVTLTGPDGNPVTDVHGDPVGPRTTDGNGRYLFDNLPVLPAGQSYTVTVDAAASADALAGKAPTVPGAGTDRGADSSTGSAASGELSTDGASDRTLDFGYYRVAVSVGDKVWNDLNRDGVQGSGEPGLGGVTLSITGPDGNLVTGLDGQPVAPVTTGPDGGYRFENLPALPAGQSYTVTVDRAPDGFQPTTPGAGSDRAADSSTGTATTGDLTTEGAVDDTLDFGFWQSAVSVGDLVWHDLDRDGIQDAGEPGIAGVSLRLTGPDGNPVTDVFGNPVPATVTDADGHYRFENLPVLPAGQSYLVSLDSAASADALTGLEPTAAQAGTDPAADSATGQAASGELTADGASDTTLDFGYVTGRVQLGDTVWKDLDGDGVQDEGEPGIGGVVLTLTGPGGEPVLDVHGNPVEPRTTGDDGSYLFTDLPTLPGGQGYTVTVDQLASAQALAGLVPTVTGAGTPDTDSATGSATSGELTTPDAADLSLDFGFRPAAVTVGDKVWNDLNRNGIQDEGEPGISGVVLTLTGPDGQVVTVHGTAVTPVTTGADGSYEFADLPVLPAGQHYTVTVDEEASAQALTGLAPTLTGQGTQQTDSSTGSARSGELTADGDRDDSLDFGYAAPVSEPGDTGGDDDTTDTGTGSGTGTNTGTGGTGTGGTGTGTGTNTNTGTGGGTGTNTGTGTSTGTRGSGSSASTPTSANRSGSLARTGADAGIVAGLGAALIGLGAVLRRRRTS